MPIYHLNDTRISPVKRTNFSDEGVFEREDIQRLIQGNIDIISPDTLVVSEEFNQWDSSRARIDLLGIDKEANIIVIELKRTSDGGYMELQALRYAAMISSLTFGDLVEKYQTYLENRLEEKDAKENLVEFLDLDDTDEILVGQEVKIVLASQNFSKELTTSVLWLNERGLDIRCVRMQPYSFNAELLVDIQTIIPVPEATDYQVKVRAKKIEERELRRDAKDRTKFDVSIAGIEHKELAKRGMMLLLVQGVLSNGGTPQEIVNVIPQRKLISFEGHLSADRVREEIMKKDRGGKIPRSARFFCDKDEDLHYHQQRTYVLSNQWGTETLQSVRILAEKFPELNIECKPTA